MPRFRKLPVTIEAEPFTEETKDWVLNWVNHSGGHSWPNIDVDRKPTLSIQTLEGVMTANLGDWIIKGVAGEFYPCKNHVFEATYEAVE